MKHRTAITARWLVQPADSKKGKKAHELKPRASSRPTYRSVAMRRQKKNGKKEEEISPTLAEPKIRYRTFPSLSRIRILGGGRGVENRAEKRSIVKLAQGWGHRRFGLDLMEESRNDRPAVLAEEEGSGGGGDDDDLAEADTEGRKCNRSQELEIESNFLHLLALSLLSPLPRPDHSFSQTVGFRSSSTAACPPLSPHRFPRNRSATSRNFLAEWSKIVYILFFPLLIHSVHS